MICPVRVISPSNVISPVPDSILTAVAPVLLPIVTVLATAPVPIFILLLDVVLVPMFILPDVVLIVTAESPTVISSAADELLPPLLDMTPLPLIVIVLPSTFIPPRVVVLAVGRV